MPLLYGNYQYMKRTEKNVTLHIYTYSYAYSYSYARRKNAHSFAAATSLSLRVYLSSYTFVAMHMCTQTQKIDAISKL